MRRVLPFVLLAASSVAQAGITIDNFDAGDEVRYPLVILRGRAEGGSIALGRDWPSAARFPVVDKQFTAFVELKPGPNMLVMTSGKTTMKFRLDYRPMTSPNKVLAVWVRASDEPDAPALQPPGTDPKLRDKFDIAMKLMQGFTAEAMHAAGFGRITFPLETDGDGKVVLHKVVSPLTGSELRKMESNASWGHIYSLLKPIFPEDSTRWCTLFGWTSYDPEKRQPLGHYALGGGALATFGTGNMPVWPSSLKEAVDAFSNVTAIDPANQFEDSNRRETVWANVSTAYGAMLHELGHTFGLPHSNDPFSVMSRGFDFFSRSFTTTEAPRRGQTEPVRFKSDETARWDPYFAARLALSPFFKPDSVEVSTQPGPRVWVEGDEIKIESSGGLKLWGAERDDVTPVFQLLSETVTSLVLKTSDLREKLKTDQPFRVLVIDSAGRQASVEIK